MIHHGPRLDLEARAVIDTLIEDAVKAFTVDRDEALMVLRDCRDRLHEITFAAASDSSAISACLTDARSRLKGGGCEC